MVGSPGFLPARAATTSSPLAPKPKADLVVRSDFPGGAAEVLEIDQQARKLRVKPPSRPERGMETWWYFKVEGIMPREKLTLEVESKFGIAKPNQLFYSLDGKIWTLSGPAIHGPDKERVVYQQAIHAAEAWFAWGPPYLPSHTDELIAKATQSSSPVRAFELCVSRGGHRQMALRIQEPGTIGKPVPAVWVIARQHAWESGSSWTAQGLVEWLISDDPRAVRLRSSTEIVVVPIMDIDNVVLGNGGRGEKPRDHNRDWDDKPHWRAVEAAQREIQQLDAEGRFRLFIDLHNPDHRFPNPYFFRSCEALLAETGRQRLADFFAAAKIEMGSPPLAFLGLPAEAGPRYDKTWATMSQNWVNQKCRPDVVAVCLETAWNTPDSSIEGYRHVAAGLGRAIDRFLHGELAPGTGR